MAILCDIYNNTSKEISNDVMVQRVTKTIEEKANEINLDINRNVKVDIQIVSLKMMREIYGKWMGKSHATDVLSFPIGNKNDYFVGGDGTTWLGSLVVCLDVAKTQAKRNKHSLTDELLFLVDHGTLHLLGFHHD